MFYIHILTHPGRIENKGTHEYKILTDQQEQAYLDEGLAVREHDYKLQCGEASIEVRCPEIAEMGSTDGAKYLILPEFLLPGRPYPIYVYVYAIETYCTNPGMSQREAATRTRERFGLETFSHTTLGRAMKKLERQIEEYESAPPIEGTRNEAASEASREFPSVGQTKDRKAAVASYLMKAAADDNSLEQETAEAHKNPNYKRPPYTGAFIDACHAIARQVFLSCRRLLL